MYRIEKYNEKNKHMYFAMIYNVVQNDIKPWLDIDFSKDVYFVAYIDNTMLNKMTDKDRSKLLKNIDLDIGKHRLVPIVECGSGISEQKRTVLVIYSKAGSGKSCLANSISLIYNQMHRKKVFYISNNNPMHDNCLMENADIYQFIDIFKFIERYKDKEEMDAFKTSDEYKGCLFFIDDVHLNKDDKKVFFTWVNIVCELKRKMEISLILCVHSKGKDYGSMTRVLDEMTGFCLFNSNLLNKSDEILKNMNVPRNIIEKINNDSVSRWTTILGRQSCVITQNELYKVTQ